MPRTVLLQCLHSNSFHLQEDAHLLQLGIEDPLLLAAEALPLVVVAALVAQRSQGVQKI